MRIPGTKCYRFEIGNTTDGALGMVISIWAKSPEEAVKKANDALSGTDFLRIFGRKGLVEGVDYANVYFAPNLRLADLDGCEKRS